MKKKILICLLVGFLTILISSCRRNPKDFDHGGYLAYRELRNGTIEVVGLTKLGMEQEVIVIPRTIDGKHVSSITLIQKSMLSQEPLIPFGSEALKRMYILPNEKTGVSIADSLFENSYYPNGEPTIPMNIEKVISFDYYHNLNSRINYYILPVANDVESLSYANYANVLYHYNYEVEDDVEYYFIDDYENEKISYIPDNPTREGYLFEGWFKEVECINLFDFENEVIPEKEYYEVVNDGITYRLPITTNLYAKWNKKINK